MSAFKDDVRLRLSGSWQSTVDVAGSLGPQRGLDHYQLVRKTYSHLLRMEEDGEVVSIMRTDEEGRRMRFWRLVRCRRSRSTS